MLATNLLLALAILGQPQNSPPIIPYLASPSKADEHVAAHLRAIAKSDNGDIATDMDETQLLFYGHYLYNKTTTEGGKQFAAFITGAIKAKPPTWWTDHIVNLASLPKPARYKNIMTGSIIINERQSTYDDIAIDYTSNTIRIPASAVLDATYRLGDNTRELLSKHHGTLSFGRSGRTLLAATYDNTGMGYNLYCIDDNRVKWKAKCWALNIEAMTGVNYHRTSIVVAKDRVHVFGASSNIYYIESFRFDNGNPGAKYISTCKWSN
jgi:hypothetical protein